VERDEAPELHDIVERLCAMADLPKPKVAIVDTDVPNAFATGRSPKHAAVAVTTGLWRRLDKEEIEGVLAHELSHVANRDVLVMTVASFFAMLAALLTRFGLYAGMFGGFGGGTEQQQQQHARLADRPGGLDRHLRDQLILIRPSPLPRVRGRPRLGADHRRARDLMSALQKISSQITMIPDRDLREVRA
jgi:heat shock protein HtpX